LKREEFERRPFGGKTGRLNDMGGRGQFHPGNFAALPLRLAGKGRGFGRAGTGERVGGGAFAGGDRTESPSKGSVLKRTQRAERMGKKGRVGEGGC